MIAFQVKLNGELLTIAGAEDLCVLSVDLTCMGGIGVRTRQLERDEERHGVLTLLRAGGLTSREGEDELLNWIDGVYPKIGDEISVKLVEVERSSLPVKKSERKDVQDTIPKKTLALKVKYPGGDSVIASREDAGIIAFSCTATGKLGSSSLGTDSQRSGEYSDGYISSAMLYVSCKSKEEGKWQWLKWLDNAPLEVGDEYVFKIVDTDEFSKPISVEVRSD